MVVDSSSVFVIAEAGVNHNGSMDMALELVEAAAEAKADAIKFQTFSAEKLLTTTAPKAAYQLASTSKQESQYEMIRSLELSHDEHHVLKEHCHKYGIKFLSSAFDLESITFLRQLDLQVFKIPSGEITNLPYLRQIGSFGMEVLLSTGMATLEEVEEAVAVLEFNGTPKDHIVVLQCHTEYPTPMNDVNLRAMTAMGDHLGIAVGYSDHTMGFEVAIAAVALGAKVIEKHFTLDRNLDGPDHRASLEPQSVREMVEAIRNVETALGSSSKVPTEKELENRRTVRKSIVAVHDIAEGHRFTERDLMTKRPGTGLSPMVWDDVIGKKAKRGFRAEELIEL